MQIVLFNWFDNDNKQSFLNAKCFIYVHYEKELNCREIDNYVKSKNTCNLKHSLSKNNEVFLTYV